MTDMFGAVCDVCTVSRYTAGALLMVAIEKL